MALLLESGRLVQYAIGLLEVSYAKVFTSLQGVVLQNMVSSNIHTIHLIVQLL